MIAKKKINVSKLLEITMRDVMDGLEDAATYMSYHSSPDVVEILSIEPPGRPTPKETKLIPMELYGSDNSDIIEYLIQRELKKSA